MTKPIIIDGKLLEVEPGTTILQACEMAGAEIPRFCYHERLSIAGNCRMCLVEVEGIPKPIASCAMGVTDLPPNRDGAPRSVLTASPLVKAAREGVMEFLLINHPLDCPICDQGGECDLQDQAMAFGFGGSRYIENKRAVEEKYIGPLIKTFMNRCIHCTRCIRFMTEVAGVEELGAIGRGEDMEITTYLDRGILSELSANVNDLCPVGALTHRPWSFIARPWELENTESFDVMDARRLGHQRRLRAAPPCCASCRATTTTSTRSGSPTRRALPATACAPSGSIMPYVREGGKLRPASWDEALALAAEKLSAAAPERIGAIAGDLAGAEEMFALKDLLGRLGAKSLDCRQDGAKLDPALGRASYVFNSTIAGIDQADAILLIGTNPRARGGGAERAHPEALAPGRPQGRRHRRAGAADIRLRVHGRRRADARRTGGRQALVRRDAESRAAAAGHRRLGRCGARRRRRDPRHGGAHRAGRRRRARTLPAGTRSTCCTRRPRASPVSTSASCRRRAGSMPPASSPPPARASSTCCTCSAPTRSTLPAAGNPSSSTRATTAIAARIAPTSSCRAPPTPRRAPPTSTPKGARR